MFVLNHLNVFKSKESLYSMSVKLEDLEHLPRLPGDRNNQEVDAREIALINYDYPETDSSHSTDRPIYVAGVALYDNQLVLVASDAKVHDKSTFIPFTPYFVERIISYRVLERVSS